MRCLGSGISLERGLDHCLDKKSSSLFGLELIKLTLDDLLGGRAGVDHEVEEPGLESTHPRRIARHSQHPGKLILTEPDLLVDSCQIRGLMSNLALMNHNIRIRDCLLT